MTMRRALGLAIYVAAHVVLVTAHGLVGFVGAALDQRPRRRRFTTDHLGDRPWNRSN